MDRLTTNPWLSFLKIRSLNFLLKALEYELDRARFSVEFVGVCRLKLLTPGGVVDVSPHSSSLWTGQHTEMDLNFQWEYNFAPVH